jgi:hypothetical protein
MHFKLLSPAAVLCVSLALLARGALGHISLRSGSSVLGATAQRKLLQTSQCWWAAEFEECRAVMSEIFPSKELILAVANQRAHVSVCLSWMAKGGDEPGACREGEPATLM